MTKFKLKPLDYLVMGLVLLIGTGGFWHNLNPQNRPGRNYIQVFVENRLVAELSAGPGESYEYSFNFGLESEHTAIIEIEDGKVRMLDLGSELCPRGICSHTGWISQSYERIVCLPNRILVLFSQDGPGNEGIDGITY